MRIRTNILALSKNTAQYKKLLYNRSNWRKTTTNRALNLKKKSSPDCFQFTCPVYFQSRAYLCWARSIHRTCHQTESGPQGVRQTKKTSIIPLVPYRTSLPYNKPGTLDHLTAFVRYCIDSKKRSPDFCSQRPKLGHDNLENSRKCLSNVRQCYPQPRPHVAGELSEC